jgi:hypothetical protein
METTQVAVDLAKSVFEIAVSHQVGHVAQHRRLNRQGFRRFLESLEPSEILMEACCTSHYWGRECRAMGHRVRLCRRTRPVANPERYRTLPTILRGQQQFHVGRHFSLPRSFPTIAAARR